MAVFDICYSLNSEVTITADTYEEAEKKLRAQLAEKGINIEKEFFLEVFDVNEE